MSAEEILNELPKLSRKEQEIIARTLQELRSAVTPSKGSARQPDLHAGAWEVDPTFDETLPEDFWTGGVD